MSTKGAFTSRLRAHDFRLIQDQGYIPLGLVMGNSVFSMGLSGGISTALRGLTRGELTEYTQLMYDARQLSLARLKEEADRLGADGVIGVTLRVTSRGTDVMEVAAVGTAVKATGPAPNDAPVKVVISRANEPRLQMDDPAPAEPDASAALEPMADLFGSMMDSFGGGF